MINQMPGQQVISELDSLSQLQSKLSSPHSKLSNYNQNDSCFLSGMEEVLSQISSSNRQYVQKKRQQKKFSTQANHQDALEGQGIFPKLSQNQISIREDSAEDEQEYAIVSKQMEFNKMTENMYQETVKLREESAVRLLDLLTQQKQAMKNYIEILKKRRQKHSPDKRKEFIFTKCEERYDQKINQSKSYKLKSINKTINTKLPQINRKLNQSGLELRQFAQLSPPKNLQRERIQTIDEYINQTRDYNKDFEIPGIKDSIWLRVQQFQSKVNNVKQNQIPIRIFLPNRRLQFNKSKKLINYQQNLLRRNKIYPILKTYNIYTKGRLQTIPY